MWRWCWIGYFCGSSPSRWCSERPASSCRHQRCTIPEYQSISRCRRLRRLLQNRTLPNRCYNQAPVTRYLYSWWSSSSSSLARSCYRGKALLLAFVLRFFSLPWKTRPEDLTPSGIYNIYIREPSGTGRTK